MTKIQNGFEHLNLKNSNLFRISEFVLRILNWDAYNDLKGYLTIY